MARGGDPLCNRDRCRSQATRHMEFRSTGGTYVKNHVCATHEVELTRDIQRSFGLSPTTRTLDKKCREGRC